MSYQKVYEALNGGLKKKASKEQLVKLASLIGMRKRAAQPFVEQQSADYYDPSQDPAYKQHLQYRAVTGKQPLSKESWQKNQLFDSMLGKHPPMKTRSQYYDSLLHAIYGNKNFKPLIDVDKAKKNQQQRLKNPAYLWNTTKDFWRQPLQNLDRLFR